MVFVAVAATACKKAPTEETLPPQLLLDKLGVSVVPGGSEEVSVTATDEQDSSRQFTVACDDEAVATVTTTGSTITVTGRGYGTANVTVTSDTCVRILPVKVYDPNVVEAGELLIAFADEFEYRWCSMGSPDTWDASFYHPVTSNGYHALGSFGFRGFGDPKGTMSVMVVRALPGSDALKPPVDYDSVWNTRGSAIEDNGSLWTPVPPPGYKALGTVAQRGYGKPSLDDVVCVRQDLTVPGACGDGVFWGNNGAAECMAYSILPPDVGAHDSSYLQTRTFSGARISPDSTGHPALHVLKVKLPMMPEAPDQSFAPRLSGYDKPPDQTEPVMAREMAVPWTTVRDDASHPEGWRYANSPNYRVERMVFYKLLYHNYNQTSEVQPNSYEISCGVESESSQAYSEKTGLSLSVALGVSYKGVAWGGSLTVTGTYSREFGYETRTSVKELERTTTTTGLNIPPGKAGAIWQKYTRFVVKRHNTQHLEPVATMDYPMNSFVTDVYPHDE